MSILENFLAYATDFEKTLDDDDWSRLRGYFSNDCVYRVESNWFGCELTGLDAIFAGMKKSLNGFDRHFASRDFELKQGPDVVGDEISMAWELTYHKPELSDFPFRGRSMARFRDDKIALLVDSYDNAVADEAREWMRENGIDLDPSYT
jgi:hypothetical protein